MDFSFEIARSAPWNCHSTGACVVQVPRGSLPIISASIQALSAPNPRRLVSGKESTYGDNGIWTDAAPESSDRFGSDGRPFSGTSPGDVQGSPKVDAATEQLSDVARERLRGVKSSVPTAYATGWPTSCVIEFAT